MTISAIYVISDRMYQLTLANLDPRAWRAELPDAPRVRTIAAIVTHVHNVRCKWIRLTAPHLGVPAMLNRARCTQRQAARALVSSARRCADMLADETVTKFRRDGWGGTWSSREMMFAYMLAHEQHHRGQICLLAHQLGYPLQGKANYGVWRWEALSR